jgi:hypothetical protein
MVRIWLVLLIGALTPVASTFCADPTKSNNSEPIVSRIPRQPVQSTAIAAVGYSKRRHVLEIEFVNGATYRYLDVPLSVYRGLMSAESKARFYDLNIKRKYRSVRLRSYWKDERHN